MVGVQTVTLASPLLRPPREPGLRPSLKGMPKGDPMEQRPPQEVWFTAAECARRIGITVRALRVYEQYGLIAPRRTMKDWRLYGAGEIARLNEVLILKSFGLPLSRIAALLKGRAVDLRKLLELQHESVSNMRDRAEKGLRLIETARAALAAGEKIAIDDLTNLAREAAMADNATDNRAWKKYEQARPRTETAIDPAAYADYVGAYRFEDGMLVSVGRDGERFFIKGVGQPNTILIPEAPDRFFARLGPVQVTFERNAKGRVESLVLHQHGFENKATRVSADAFQKAEEALKLRVKNQTALPDSEAMIRRIIETHVAGKPDYDRMTPSLAAIAREVADDVKTNFLRDAGPLQSVVFKSVTPGGADLYTVRFENLSTEWGFALTPTGKIGTLFIRPGI